MERTIQLLFLGLFVVIIGLGGLLYFIKRNTQTLKNQMGSLDNVSSDVSEKDSSQNDPTQSQHSVDRNTSQKIDEENELSLVFPIKYFQDTITKKKFGTYITPEKSPVHPERFKGYHTGVDIEIPLTDLLNEIIIYSIDDGKVRYAQYTKGYGGVIVIEYVIHHQTITAIYAHLKLSSINFHVGDTIKRGQRIGILGKNESEETDGERKHLHFGIHKGPDINLKGYVDNETDLQEWLNPELYLESAQHIDKN